MDRRTFIGAVAVGIIVAPLSASAQSATTIRRIGYLTSGTEETPAELQKAWALPLKEYGWIDGRNLLVERRYASGRAELLQPFAEELVRLKVEIIVTGGTDATVAAKNATTTIAIVFRSAGDPVRAGFVGSLAHPGGNITGFSVVGPELDAKGIALLRELLPGLQRVGVLENSTNPYYRAARKELEQACRSLSIQPIFVEGATASELEDAVGEVARRRGQALLIAYEALFYANRVKILRAVVKHALPNNGRPKNSDRGWHVSFLFRKQGGARRSRRGVYRQDPPRRKTRRSPS